MTGQKRRIDADPDADDATPTTPTGLIDDRYRPLRRIGSGRLGNIFEAREEEPSGAESGRLVALQLVRGRIGDDRGFVDALRRGYATLRAGPHPNIVGLRDFGAEGDTFFIVLELLEGATLEFVLREVGALPANEAWPVVREIGDALDYLHAKAMVHGRLTPDAVFINDDQRVKLIDLVPAGPPAVIPSDQPEPDERPPDIADDVLALGCIAYELLSGRHPYNSLSAAEARKAGMEPRRIESLGDREWQALARCLALDPDERTPSVMAFLDDIAASRGAGPASDAGEALPPNRVSNRSAGPATGPGRPGWVFVEADDGADSGIRSERRMAAARSDSGGGKALLWLTVGALVIAAVWVYRESLTERAFGLLAAIFNEQTVTDEPIATESPAVSTPDPLLEIEDDPVLGVPQDVDSQAPVLAVREVADDDEASAVAVAGDFARRFSVAESGISTVENAGFAAVTVRRTGDTSAPVSLLWWTSDQTATAGDDFAELGVRREEFGPGIREIGLNVPLVNDGVAEPTEHFQVHIELIGQEDGGERESVPLPTVLIAIGDDD